MSSERFIKAIAVSDEENYFNVVKFKAVLERCYIMEGTAAIATEGEDSIIRDVVEAICSRKEYALDSKLNESTDHSANLLQIKKDF